MLHLDDSISSKTRTRISPTRHNKLCQALVSCQCHELLAGHEQLAGNAQHVACMCMAARQACSQIPRSDGRLCHASAHCLVCPPRLLTAYCAGSWSAHGAAGERGAILKTIAVQLTPDRQWLQCARRRNSVAKFRVAEQRVGAWQCRAPARRCASAHGREPASVYSASLAPP